MKRFAAICVVLSSFPSIALGTSYARPTWHIVHSPNRQFVLEVNPKTEIHTVYHANDRETAHWSFKRAIWIEEIFLANDGKSVAITRWEHVDVDALRTKCIQFWTEAGEIKSYTLEEICPLLRPRNPGEIGPVGDTWGIWRSKSEQIGDMIFVNTTEPKQWAFSIRDGQMLNLEEMKAAASERDKGWRVSKDWLWGAGLGLVLFLTYLWMRTGPSKEQVPKETTDHVA